MWPNVRQSDGVYIVSTICCIAEYTLEQHILWTSICWWSSACWWKSIYCGAEYVDGVVYVGGVVYVVEERTSSEVIVATYICIYTYMYNCS